MVFDLQFLVSVPGSRATSDMRGYLGRLTKNCVLTSEWLSQTMVQVPNLKFSSLFKRISQQTPVFEKRPE